MKRATKFPKFMRPLVNVLYTEEINQHKTLVFEQKMTSEVVGIR